jgi:hypothetical protein
MTRRAFRCASFALPCAASVPFQCLMQPPSGFVAGRVWEKPFDGFADQSVAKVEGGECFRQAMARPATIDWIGIVKRGGASRPHRRVS